MNKKPLKDDINLEISYAIIQRDCYYLPRKMKQQWFQKKLIRIHISSKIRKREKISKDG